jgi:hypothetical protein
VRSKAALVVALGLLTASGVAHADPQASGALTVGGGAVGIESGGRAVPVFHLGGRADVLFLRSHDRDMAIGPYVEVASEAFHSFETGGGIDWLIPAVESFPFILSAGAAARHTSETGWEPGLTSALFFGSRGYNYHSWYGLTVGLFVQGRYSLGPSHDADVIGGLELDLSVFAFPFLFAYGALHK